MQFFRHLNVFRAVQDLRVFLAQESPHKLAFALLSVVVFGALLVGFTIDGHQEVPYHRDITYVEQWPANRSDAEIVAQQRIDGPIEAKRKADEAARAKALQDDFKKLDDKLKKVGI